MDQVVGRILRHSFANGVKLVVSVGAGLALSPVLIHSLGIETYGAWAMICAIAQFVYIADFGLSSALSKYVAESSGEDLPERVGRLVVAALAICCTATIGFLGIGLIAGDWIHGRVLQRNLVGLAMSHQLIAVMMVVSWLNLVTGVLVGVLNGLQRMDVASYIGSVATLLNFVVTVGLLALGWGLWAPAAGSALAAVVPLVLVWIQVYRTSGCRIVSMSGLRLGATWEALRGLLFLSASDGTNRAAFVLLGAGIRFLLGMRAGLQAVGYYELASRFVAQLAMISVNISSPLVPAMAGLGRAPEAVNEVIWRVLKYMNIVSLPFFAFGIIFAQTIVRAWLGNGYELVAIGVQILGVATYVNLLTVPAYHSLIGLGRPKLGVQFGVLNVTLNAMVTGLLTWQWGFAGAVTGQGVALAAASVVFLVRFHREQGLPLLRTHWDTFGKPCLAVMIVSIPVVGVYYMAARAVRWSSIAGLVAAYGVYTVLFGVVLWYSKMVSRHDLELVRGMLRG